MSEFNIIKTRIPFIVITVNLPVDASVIIKECYINGILECIINPETANTIFVKIKRYLNVFKRDLIEKEESKVCII